MAAMISAVLLSSLSRSWATMVAIWKNIVLRKTHFLLKIRMGSTNTLRYDDGATRWVRYYPYQWPYFYPIGWHPHSTDRVHPTRNGSPNHPSKTNCTPKALGSVRSWAWFGDIILQSLKASRWSWMEITSVICTDVE
jgi:hypothetical protein